MKNEQRRISEFDLMTLIDEEEKKKHTWKEQFSEKFMSGFHFKTEKGESDRELLELMINFIETLIGRERREAHRDGLVKGRASYLEQLERYEKIK